MNDYIGYIRLFYKRELKEKEHFNSKKQRKEIIHNWKQLHGLNSRYFYIEVSFQYTYPSKEEMKLIKKLEELEELV